MVAAVSGPGEPTARLTVVAEATIAEHQSVGAEGTEIVQSCDNASVPLVEPVGAEARKEIVNVKHIGLELGQLLNGAGAVSAYHSCGGAEGK